MKITSFKFAIILFTVILFKRILFPEWEFTKVDFNSTELLLMVLSLGFSFYYWIKLGSKNTIVKKITALFTLAICSLFIYQKLPSENNTIKRIELSDNEEILINQLDPSVCIGDLEFCTDSIKITRYNIFQRKEIL